MFELMRPKKEMVGKRIRDIKEELGVSFTELGDRLGLIKPTINSYVQGYTLAPHEVIEQLAKITGKSMAWFYFGEMEDYIRDYLLKTGHEVLLIDYPNLPLKLKQEFINSENESWDWKNEFGYPCEESLDEVFSEFYHDIMKEYILTLTKEYLAVNYNLESAKQEETVQLIASEMYNSFYALEDFQYGDKEEIEKSIKFFYEQNVKDKDISFDEEYLIGKLINILRDDDQTVDLINKLSKGLTGKGQLNMNSSGNELIKIFQSMRSELINLYIAHTSEEFYDWFEK